MPKFIRLTDVVNNNVFYLNVDVIASVATCLKNKDRAIIIFKHEIGDQNYINVEESLDQVVHSLLY